MGGPEGAEGIDPAWPALIATVAAAFDEVQAVWVFGSRARRTARPDSDLDLGVRTGGDLASEAAGDFMAIRSALTSALAAAIPSVKVEVWDAIPGWSTDIVWPAIMREGVLVYEREGGA